MLKSIHHIAKLFKNICLKGIEQAEALPRKYYIFIYYWNAPWMGES